ncbi:MAG: penicillin-binding protein [Oscillospiraceae bacterium]|nr:penicillin-binding protein [Oscillospiraceae bacterium]
MINNKNRNNEITDIYSSVTGSGAVKKPKKKKRGKKAASPLKKVLMFVAKMIAVFILVGTITVSITITALTVYVMRFLQVTDDNAIDLDQAKLSTITTIYANDAAGNEIELKRLSRSERREWVDLDEIPVHVQLAFVYIEDERFFNHEGVDWKRTFGAFANLFLNIWDTRQGGSTITQQTVKNITGDDDQHGFVGVERKVREIFRSMNMERVYSKNEILEAYLNIVHVGFNTGGIQAAANLYFDKDASELTVVEGAAIASILRSPYTLNPISNPERNKERRGYCLRKMRDFNVISEAEYQKYVEEDLVLRSSGTGSPAEPEATQSYFVDHVINSVITDLAEKLNISEKEAEDRIYGGGYRIYSTIDLEMQARLEAGFMNPANFGNPNAALPTPPRDASASLRESLSSPPQAAMVVFDHNGAMKAVVGGKGEKTGGDRGVINRATQTTRSMGSAVKPITVYSLAVEKNLVTWSSMVEDTQVTEIINNVPTKWPRNFGGSRYGPMPFVQAVQRSLNTVPVNLVYQLGTRNAFDFINDNFKFTSLVETAPPGGVSDARAGALCLGDFVKGLKLHELTACYQIFANGGVYTPPHAYTRVINTFGEEVLNANVAPVRVIDETTAGVMNRILSRVVDAAPGTGTAAKLDNLPVSGKTGTSSETKDYAFIGVTPHFIAGYWTGFDQPYPMESMLSTGALYSSARAWKNLVEPLTEGMPAANFNISPRVVERNGAYYRPGTAP